MDKEIEKIFIDGINKINQNKINKDFDIDNKNHKKKYQEIKYVDFHRYTVNEVLSYLNKNKNNLKNVYIITGKGKHTDLLQSPLKYYTKEFLDENNIKYIEKDDGFLI